MPFLIESHAPVCRKAGRLNPVMYSHFVGRLEQVMSRNSETNLTFTREPSLSTRAQRWSLGLDRTESTVQSVPGLKDEDILVAHIYRRQTELG